MADFPPIKPAVRVVVDNDGGDGCSSDNGALLSEAADIFGVVASTAGNQSLLCATSDPSAAPK